jgi:hypothetical protein
MHNLVKLSGAAILVSALAFGSSALAAPVPDFRVDNNQTASDFNAALGYFKPSDIKALDQARTVKIVTYNDWALDGSDDTAAEQKTGNIDKIADAGPQIAQTQRALSADPAAAKLLRAHGISIGSVAGVEAGRSGEVTLYVM